MSFKNNNNKQRSFTMQAILPKINISREIMVKVKETKVGIHE